MLIIMLSEQIYTIDMDHFMTLHIYKLATNYYSVKCYSCPRSFYIMPKIRTSRFFQSFVLTSIKVPQSIPWKKCCLLIKWLFLWQLLSDKISQILHKLQSHPGTHAENTSNVWLNIYNFCRRWSYSLHISNTMWYFTYRGNMRSDRYKPYYAGATNASCPNSAKSGLCGE